MTFADMLATAQHSAVHLEMRDEYTPDDPAYLRWKADGTIDVDAYWREWLDLAGATIARGVSIRRARIISEPVTDFVRHEYDLTGPLNLAAGESVRWLPRRQASDLTLPGNDFWVFDDHLVRFGFFSGIGDYLGEELTDTPAVIKLCLSAFDAVWERAIDHADYRPA
ncbi:DUF6879 family protein [Streptosporangium sp. NPDC002544]|uniref:DUF6879 family protein n=1 Tax=Streptosporangium sp. NPDC002544 TaxID=3154538 RepID=UPI00331FD153